MLQPSTPSAWSRSELGDPHSSPDKPAKVRGMFAAIAPTYDLNNRLHSLWRDQAWRRRAVAAAAVRTGQTVLDVACGTGELTEAFARRSPAARVIGIDFTPQMLDLARRKRDRLPPDLRAKIEYLEGDAQSLPFGDASADAVSIAFGIRNVQEPARALSEFARVLRPGARLVILEFDRPAIAPVRWLNDLYSGWLMPRTATLLSRDRTGAYRYLPRSVGTFMARRDLCALIEATGFTGVHAQSLTLGICALYAATRRG